MASTQIETLVLLDALAVLKPERFRLVQRSQSGSIYRVSLAQPGEALDDITSTLVHIVSDRPLSSQNDSILVGAVFAAIACEESACIALELNKNNSCGCRIFWGGVLTKTDHWSRAIACLRGLVEFYNQKSDLAVEGAA